MPVTFRRSSLHQRESYFVAGTDLYPAINMNRRSPSRHSSDAEEEDSPLQQSAYTSHPPMVDSYREDVTSEAKEEVAGQAAEEAAEQEGNDGGAEEEEQDGGIRAEEEQIPVTTQKIVIQFLLIQVPNFGPR
jgi:hypothetical protein